MTKKLILLASIASAITLNISAQQKKTTPAKAATYKSALPEGSKYIEPNNMNKSVSPGDNFYEYANGGWLKSNPVPSTETRWGSFNILNDYTQNAVKEILESTSKTSGAKGTPEQMVGDFYSSGMNTEQIEKLGIAPLLPLLAKVDAIKSYDDLINHLAFREKAGLSGVFRFSVGPDDKDVTKNICNMFQGGLGLPDKDYYFKTDERTVKIQDGYKALLKNLLVLGGATEMDATRSATMIYDLEKSLADKSMNRVEMRDPYKMYNKMTFQELSSKTGGFDWLGYMAKLGIKNEKQVIVAQPEFMAHVIGMLKKTSINDWKTFLRAKSINDMAPFLSSAFENARFDFYGKILRGQKEQKPRWKRVSGIVDGGVGMQIGKIYVKKYFTKEAKARMQALVNNLQAVYLERIQKLDWMSPATKAKAIVKLKSFMKKIGYPDVWKSYEGLNISKDNYVQNILNSNEFDYNWASLLIEAFGA
jgi:putative endopeptidase